MSEDKPEVTASEPARQPAPAADVLGARLRGALPFLASSVVLIAAGVLAGSILWSRGDHAELTRGVILVETPQVYTRERLVNDRFVQDGWLRNVLKEEPGFSVTETASISTAHRTILQTGGEASAAAEQKARPAGAEDKPAAAAAERQLGMPPSLNFLMRNSFRELVRGHLIENQLDDRHDIRGTTLYLFKFDASILPGDNTRRPAFVRVHVKHYDPAPAGAKAGTERYIEQHVSLMDKDQQTSAAENFKLYQDWIKSLQDRLNSVFSDVLRRFNSDDFRLAEYNNFLDLIGERTTRELFYSWSSALVTLDEHRDALQSDKKRGGADRPVTKTDAGPRDTEINARFHFLAKYILSAAAAGDRLDIEVSRFRDLLYGTEGLPNAPDATQLRREFLYYAIRRVGRYVVGDTSFTLGGFQPESPTRVATISTKTLDPFIEMTLQRKGERGLYQIAVFPRNMTLIALGLKPDRNDENCTIEKWAQAANLSAKAWAVQSYDLQGSRVQVYPVFDPGLDQERTQELIELIPAEFLHSPYLRDVFVKAPAGGLEARHPVPGHEDCFSFAQSRDLPTGYFAFIYGIREMQTYTYATLPRLDIQVSEVSDNFAQEDKLSADLPGGGARGTLANDYRRMVRSLQPKTAVVGFSGYCTFKEPAPPPTPSTYWAWRSTVPGTGSDSVFCQGGPEGADELKFGWIISPPLEVKGATSPLSYRPMQPTQRSLSSLITVPSWWRSVSVFVETGWVNEEGRFAATSNMSYPVTLPIDYESLDTIVVGPARRDSHSPTIAIERLPDQIELEACQPAEILVPGRRLWRSTVVVLGGQRADEVLVLPDMRGIIARFGPIAPRGAWQDREGKTMRDLQVWTSEGAAGAIPVAIKGAVGDCANNRAVAQPSPSAQSSSPVAASPGGRRPAPAPN